LLNTYVQNSTSKKKRSYYLLPMGLHTYTTEFVLFVISYKNVSQLSDAKSNTIAGYYNTTIVHHRWRPIIWKRSVFERRLYIVIYLCIYWYELDLTICPYSAITPPFHQNITVLYNNIKTEAISSKNEICRNTILLQRLQDKKLPHSH